MKYHFGVFLGKKCFHSHKLLSWEHWKFLSQCCASWNSSQQQRLGFVRNKNWVLPKNFKVLIWQCMVKTNSKNKIIKFIRWCFLKVLVLEQRLSCETRSEESLCWSSAAVLLSPKLQIYSLLAAWVNLEVWSLFCAVGFRCFCTGCSLFVVLLGFVNHLYVNDPDPLFFSSLPINLLFEAHSCVSKISKWCFPVKNWVVLAWWPWLLELITKLTLWIIKPLNSVQWYSIRLTPLDNFEAALSCRLTTCPM